jgi:hypothetical protein
LIENLNGKRGSELLTGIVKLSFKYPQMVCERWQRRKRTAASREVAIECLEEEEEAVDNRSEEK